MTVQIALEVFPAQVALPGGTTVKPARVYIADGELLVYVGSGEPTLYFQRTATQILGDRTHGYQVVTDAGTVLVERTEGCGCGSVLRRMNPWPGQRRRRTALV